MAGNFCEFKLYTDVTDVVVRYPTGLPLEFGWFPGPLTALPQDLCEYRSLLLQFYNQGIPLEGFQSLVRYPIG